MVRLDSHGVNGAPHTEPESDREPVRGDVAAEGERRGEGRIVVTLPDGTSLTLIGATRLVLAFSDSIDGEVGLPS